MTDKENGFPDFPTTGFVRLKTILAPRGPIPVGRSTWWLGVKQGRYPAPLKLGPLESGARMNSDDEDRRIDGRDGIPGSLPAYAGSR